MHFDFSPKVQDLRARVDGFMQERVYPNERRFYDEIEENTRRGARWTPTRIVEELKLEAKAAGLWNLFLPDSAHGAGLKNLEYAPLAEIMGRVPWASEVFNCSAPDTGNMETIERYGSPEQKKRWLEPLLAGDIRSGFAMTEPAVASSDATNIQTEIRRDGDHYVINGRKWWTSGAGDPRCKVYIVMGKTDPTAAKHQQQSMILVPSDSPGMKVLRPLNVFGYDDAPHGHMETEFRDVRVPASNILLGEGRGFEIAQGRLGPGRIHHCMRCLGLAERALELMCKRLASRVAFGGPIARQTVWQERIAEARCMIDQARLLTLKAAYMMDTVGNKAAKAEIAMIKVVAPNVACTVLDWSIQAHGGAGVSDDFPIAYAYALARTLRLADGPDEVHRNAIAKVEIAKHVPMPPREGSPPMIELYTWPTPNGHKVHIMLEECALPYNVHAIDIGAGDQFKPDFLKISPNNKIPAIVDPAGPDGKPISIFESGAILLYLAGKTGRFLPHDVRGKYVALQWLMFQMGGVGPMLGQAHHFRIYAPEKVEYAINRYTNEAKRLYGVMDRRLGEAPYFAGEYSIADMAIFPWTRSHANQGIDLADYPNVKRWYDAIEARPAVQRGVKVLADRRKPQMSDKDKETLFGSKQYAKR